MRRVLYLGMCVALASTAMAGFTVPTQPGPLASDHAFGTAGNGFWTYSFPGPAFDCGNIIFEGDVTDGGVGSYLSELSLGITNPTAVNGFVTLTSGTTWSGTVHIGPITIGGGGSLWGTNTVGNWRFEMYEGYDDTGVDATWTNVNIQFQDYVIPAPPAATDLGAVVDLGVDPDLTTTFALAAAQVKWYKFTIAENAVSPGKYLDIDTETSVVTDTEIGLYRANGHMVATDDDDGTDMLSQLTFGDVGPRPAVGNGLAYNGRDGALVAGTYYLAVGGFNSTFGDGFAVTSTSTRTGNVTVRFGTNIIPEPASLVLIALGALALRRR